MFKAKSIDVKIRPAGLEDSESMARLQNNHVKELKILDIPKTAEKIRLAIGSSFLNKNTYYVVEEEDEIIGFIESKKQNHSHVMLSYPYVKLGHPSREEIQIHLLESTLDKLIKYGYQFVSTQVSKVMDEGTDLFDTVGFNEKQTVFQTFRGTINPHSEVDTEKIDFRRVKIGDLDLTYGWIKRQLNPMSPIHITKENYEQLLHAPKQVRDGWSMAIDTSTGEPIAMVSSMIDAQTGEVIVFGPFSDPDRDEIRIPLLNELLWYHKLQGREKMRLMRIELFDNDEVLIDTFGLDKSEEITILTKQLY